MCGVIGTLAYGTFEDKKMEKIRQESMIFLSSELLQLTQSRGKDATGIATLFENCDYMGLKMGISANEFVARFGGTEKDYEGYLNIWRKKVAPAKVVIGHCRKPSTGGNASADDNKNNHPIKVGDMVGVHNGTLNNHDVIYENLKCGRDGNVDSEAIFRLLHHYTNNGADPFTGEMLTETCNRLDGTYACLVFNGNNPYQVAAFRDGRPLEAMIIRSLKLLIIGSEKDMLRALVFRYNKMANLYGTRFSAIRESDMDIATLADDSWFLFDIREEITAETQLSQLYLTGKNKLIDKIWKKPAWNAKKKHTPAYTPVNTTPVGGAANTPSAKKTEVNANPAGAAGTGGTTPGGNEDTTATTKRIGMAYNRVSQAYEAVSEAAKKHGTVEIDAEIGSVIDAEAKKTLVQGQKKDLESSASSANGTEEIRLRESDKPIDDLITDPAKINEIAIAEIQKGATSNGTDTNTSVSGGNTAAEAGGKPTIVDVETYPEVIKLADEATRKEYSFSRDEELADAIDIKNIESMKNMAIYSLANRIKKYFYSRGWYAGYVNCLKEFELGGKGVDKNIARDLLIRARNKRLIAQATIRSIKSTTNVLARIIGNTQWMATDRHIDKAVAETLSSGEEIRMDLVTNVFRAGDLRKFPILRRVTAAVKNKQDR